MISVIVVNWNGKSLLSDCLNSLRLQAFPDFEVIVVDNGSTDGSAEFVQAAFPEFKLIPLDQNLGFAGGNNAGIREARGEWIALINNDATADPGWLAALHKAVAEDERIGFAASRVVLTSGAL